MDISLKNDKLSESQFFDDWETKKVRFKEWDGDVHVEIVMDLVSLSKVSWKQMMLGKGVSVQEKGPQSNEIDIVEDLEFLEGDVKKSMVNGLSVIEFSDLSVIIFKENSNPNKGQALGNGKNDSIGKGIFTPKVQGSGVKSGPSHSD
ncbi:hypothetical protein Goarm_010230 [Gossypium armourianum]|uniref:Uncharacterized protein n=1 Tax=Gossypium armourianum TaxID=34283 RepID=A0A7J9JVD2_9ROSI|nr:hypothetical protein [Gossypium armourianum]